MWCGWAWLRHVTTGLLRSTKQRSILRCYGENKLDENFWVPINLPNGQMKAVREWTAYSWRCRDRFSATRIWIHPRNFMHFTLLFSLQLKIIEGDRISSYDNYYWELTSQWVGHDLRKSPQHHPTFHPNRDSEGSLLFCRKVVSPAVCFCLIKDL